MGEILSLEMVIGILAEVVGAEVGGVCGSLYSFLGTERMG